MLMPYDVIAATSSPRCISHRGEVKCYAKLALDSFGHPLISSRPIGYGPNDWRRAYGQAGSVSTRVGVIVAHGDPNLYSDLAQYSSSFGLANSVLCTSPTQKSCLDMRSQDGTPGNPGGDNGWALETALDVETIHGICPTCRLEVVAARTSSPSDLLEAVDRASLLGAKVISMSWGGAEFSGETTFEDHFLNSGITYIASSGDNGYGTSWPAASANIIAVGGTNLSFSGGAPSEKAWTGSGSGCSRYESKPNWQTDAHCNHRTISDIAADADPATGAAVYHGAWYRVGGTSLAAPIIAGYAASHGGIKPSKLYALANQLHDIATGENGFCAHLRQYLCRAQNGYDGPTGLGTLSSQFVW
jgi:subtilase family serine protease